MSAYRFILGAGRSGTTFLGRVVSCTSSKIKYIPEIFPGIKTFQNLRYKDPNFINPFDTSRIDLACEILENAFSSNDILRINQKQRVERDDGFIDFLLIKEVHCLLAFPSITEKLRAKTVVITRNPLKILDSYFVGHNKKKRIYLLEEYEFFKKYLRGKKPKTLTIIDKALAKCSPKIRDYIQRPKILTSEIKRQFCVNEVLRQFLIEWSNQSTNIYHITHEELCENPIQNAEVIFKFLGLQYNVEALKKIEQVTTGKEQGYYDTNKNSREIMTQSFKFLSPRMANELNNILNVNF